jgi:SSS family solute:Na+ symporter
MFRGILETNPEMLEVPGLTSRGDPWNWGAYSSAILVSAIGLSMWPHLFMKAFTARDDRTLRRTVVLFPSFQFFLIPVFLIGFAGVGVVSNLDHPDGVLPALILSLDLPVLVVGLFCAGALSASMSTGDALLHASASVAVEDGIRPFRALQESTQRLLIRILVVVTGAVAYIFALDEDQSLVVLLLSSYGIIAQFAPPIVAAMYWQRATTAGAMAGLIAGSATTLFFFLNPALRPWEVHEGILGLLVHLPVLVGVSLLTPPQDGEHTRAFTHPRLPEHGG